MMPTFTFLNRTVTGYGIMVVVGALVCLLFIFLTGKRRHLNPGDTEFITLFGAIGALLGSKILYLITVLPDFIKDFHLLFSEPATFVSMYLAGGFVFYGGFYGALAAAAIYCKAGHADKWEAARTLMPVVPLFHFFGRIGCFLVGCCYGIESETFGVVFRNSTVAPNDVPLLPVQLFEAAGEGILFVVLMIISRKKDSGRTVLSVWLIAYGCLRFCMEFLRGDEYRGFVGIFSTSQIIALVSIAFGCLILLLGRRARRLSGREETKASGGAEEQCAASE